MGISISYGAPKITFNSKEQDYQEMKSAAMKQGDGNPYVSGYQGESPADSVKESRSRYGAVTVMPQVASGINEGYQQTDNPGNSAMNNPAGTTGSVDLGTSATASASRDPESFQSEALNRRLDTYSKAMGNSECNLNDHSKTMRA